MVSQCGFDLHFSDNEWCWASFHVFVSHLTFHFYFHCHTTPQTGLFKSKLQIADNLIHSHFSIILQKIEIPFKNIITVFLYLNFHCSKIYSISAIELPVYISHILKWLRWLWTETHNLVSLMFYKSKRHTSSPEICDSLW